MEDKYYGIPFRLICLDEGNELNRQDWKEDDVKLFWKRLRRERHEQRIKFINIPVLGEMIINIVLSRMNFIFNNHLYVTDLSEFEGKDISSISIFNSSGENIDVPLDEIVEVIDGKLYCSSYQGGIVEFVEGKYSHTFRFTTSELDIIGFYDIKVRDD